MEADQANILILQGPLGPFFADLAGALSQQGAVTHRVCFNKGDRHFALADHIVCYLGAAKDWAAWIEQYVSANQIDAVCCYGDCRYYHRQAKKVCDQLGIRFFALEEGYVRPGYVTLEEGGNNANSRFPDAFRQRKLGHAAPVEPAPVASAFRFQFWFATLYYIVKDWKLWGFGNYRHHRRGNWATELMAWVRAGLRKNLITRWREKDLTTRLVAGHKDRMFFMPLQVAVDTQMIYHSSFDSVEAFIDTAIRSFSAHAPHDAHLVIKHHPMDRGFHHYGALIRRLSAGLNCAARVTYAFDLDLERILDAARGCITVNSTVGLQALERGVPTLTLGNSMIMAAGLASGQALDDFWVAPATVVQDDVARFKQLLIAHTQQPGSFYRDRDIAAQACAKRIVLTLRQAPNSS